MNCIQEMVASGSENTTVCTADGDHKDSRPGPQATVCADSDQVRQPLVVGFSDSCPQVELDGPALRVVVANRAPRYFPLRRLSRVISGPAAEFRTDAILACAQHGIVIVWKSEASDVIARLAGWVEGSHSTLGRAIEELLGEPDWQKRYRTWLLNAEKGIARRVAEQIKAPSELGGDPGRLRIWIEQTGTFFGGETAELETRRHFDTLAVAWMTEYLHKQGLEVGAEVWDSAELDLGRDLAGLLALDVEPYRLSWLRRRHRWATSMGRLPRPIRIETAALLWERSEPNISRAGRLLVHALRRWLRPVNGTPASDAPDGRPAGA